MGISIWHDRVWMMYCYNLCTRNLAIDLISYLVALRCAQIHIIQPQKKFPRSALTLNLASLWLHSDKVMRTVLGDGMPQKTDKTIQLN